MAIGPYQGLLERLGSPALGSEIVYVNLSKLLPVFEPGLPSRSKNGRMYAAGFPTPDTMLGLEQNMGYGPNSLVHLTQDGMLQKVGI